MKWPKLFPKKANDTDDKSSVTSMGVLNWLSILLISFGIFIVLLFGANLSAKATIFLWMLACLLSGTAVGFLFGIPKILQNNQATGANVVAPTYQQQVNTNLTEISDWLTKIIVGLGLVSLSKIPPYLSAIAKVLAAGLSHPPVPPSHMAFAFAYGTIISYVILGFLFGYITTRLYLAGAFSRADQEALQTLARKTEEAVGAAQSALQKVDFAMIPNVAREQNQNPKIELDQLARNYVQIRSTMPPGSPRTRKMTEVFKEMTTTASEIDSLDVSQLLKDTDIGQRLVGYAYLYSKPDYQYLEELVDSIITDTTPFGQYWGILVLGKLIELQPASPISPNVFQKLKTYYDKLAKGIDREYELRKILPALKN